MTSQERAGLRLLIDQRRRQREGLTCAFTCSGSPSTWAYKKGCRCAGCRDASRVARKRRREVARG